MKDTHITVKFKDTTQSIPLADIQSIGMIPYNVNTENENAVFYIEFIHNFETTNVVISRSDYMKLKERFLKD